MTYEKTVGIKTDREYLSETSELIDMMGYPRPSSEMDHEVYQEFLKKFIWPVFGKPDKFGNYVHIVLDKTKKKTPIEVLSNSDVKVTDQFPRTAYMSHHDTVHAKSTLQNAPHIDRIVYTSYPHPDVTIAEKVADKPNIKNPYLNDHEKYQSVEVFNSQPRKIKIEEVKKVFYLGENGKRTHMPDMDTVTSKEINDPADVNLNCLGADCTVGIWLQLRMIRAQVPGVYVIHAEEEVGRKGSEYIVNTHRKCVEHKQPSPYYWIDLVDIAMSFDRKGFNEIITHQSGRTRCASDEFADSLSGMLSSHLEAVGYPKLIKSDKGSYTDSYSYRLLIPECINLCVGYTAQHTSRESQDVRFAYHLADALIKEGHDINDVDGPIEIERVVLVGDDKKHNSASTDPSFGRQTWPSASGSTAPKSTAGELKKSSQVSSPTEDPNPNDDSWYHDQDSWDNEYYDYFEANDDWSYNDTYAIIKQSVLSGAKINPDDENELIRKLVKDEPILLAEFIIEQGFSLTDIVEFAEN